MGRFVEPIPKGGAQYHAARGAGENYLTRVAKYVPTEVIAAYIFINGLLLSDAARALPNMFWWHFVVFTLCWILTPIYLYRQAAKNAPKLLQLLISTLAFPAWAYAVKGGVFAGAYNSIAASVIVAMFSLISGAFQPREGTR
jgi:hypothetical protein